jgi:hypothetical protein
MPKGPETNEKPEIPPDSLIMQVRIEPIDEKEEEITEPKDDEK